MASGGLWLEAIQEQFARCAAAPFCRRAIGQFGDLADGIPQLELNEGERHLLGSIGEIYHERVFAAPSNEVEAAAIYEKMINGERIVRVFYENDNLANIDFPYSPQARR
ncbi:hypothetical protein [Paenibacillus xanthanilyticus]|uniref:Uncharacterized protein n=1 Tax=Paenibacillus xanthanilyticus TaxID=1783531 RepID=A0ABV8K9C5_9BACL